MSKLPEEAQNQIFMHSLHRNFMREFRPHLRLLKKSHKGKDMIKKDGEGRKFFVHYSLDDEEYRDFVLAILKILEPRFEEAG